jgi:AraC family transcriptional regulator
MHDRAFEDVLVVALAQRMWITSGRQVTALEADGLTLGLGALLTTTDDHDSAPAPARGGLAPWQVRRVSEYLQADLAADSGLAELAMLVNLSTEHFARAFKVSTGLPPHAWLVAQRVERARELLAATSLPVEEIAAQVGYTEPSHLARMFRRAHGLSPTQYRRERRS